MLYKLTASSDQFDALEPVAYDDFSGMGLLEKDLENLIAHNILEVLFEDGRLMPIFQERAAQPEGDIYALNEKGDLVILELKRGSAGDDAVIQALAYAQDAGQRSYTDLQWMYRLYVADDSADLIIACQ